jgi:hypothetical protein
VRIVIPSVNYADMLAVSLPAWRSEFPGAEVVVVTAPADQATQETAERFGARLCVTDAW